MIRNDPQSLNDLKRRITSTRLDACETILTIGYLIEIIEGLNKQLSATHEHVDVSTENKIVDTGNLDAQIAETEAILAGLKKRKSMEPAIPLFREIEYFLTAFVQNNDMNKFIDSHVTGDAESVPVMFSALIPGSHRIELIFAYLKRRFFEEHSAIIEAMKKQVTSQEEVKPHRHARHA